jgi:hypothetical protein
MNRARENGWQNVLYGPESPVSEQKNNIDPNYQRYHQQLDKFQDKCKQIEKRGQENIANILKNYDNDNVNRNNNAFKVTPSPANRILNGSGAKLFSQKSKETNFYIDEFRRRKAQFERNKARGVGIGYNPIRNNYPVNAAKPPLAKRDERTDYEQKLRQIRLQNYNNRKELNHYNLRKPTTPSVPVSAAPTPRQTPSPALEDSFKNNRLKRQLALKVNIIIEKN